MLREFIHQLHAEGSDPVALIRCETDIQVCRIQVATDLINQIRKKAIGMEITEGVTASQQFVKIMEEELTRILGSSNAPLAHKADGVTTILMCGLQGTGSCIPGGKCQLLSCQQSWHRVQVCTRRDKVSKF